MQRDWSSGHAGSGDTRGGPNCWEFNRCGREPSGSNVTELGVCPAASETSADGLNGGRNAGRICWAVGGTLCGGKVQGTQAQKLRSCTDCAFFRVVSEQQGVGFFTLPTRVLVYAIDTQEMLEEQEYRFPPLLVPGMEWRVLGSMRLITGTQFVRDGSPEHVCVKAWVR